MSPALLRVSRPPAPPAPKWDAPEPTMMRIAARMRARRISREIFAAQARDASTSSTPAPAPPPPSPPPQAAQESPTPTPQYSDTLKDLRRRAVDAIVGGLQVQTFSRWVDYWFAPTTEDPDDRRIGDYMHIANAMRDLLAVIDDQYDHEAYERTCHESLIHTFPDASEELDFLAKTVGRSARISAELNGRPAPADKLSADRDIAAHFNWYGTIYSLCVTSLNVVAEPKAHGLDDRLQVTQSVIDGLLALARESALEMHHAAMQGRKLRRASSAPTEDELATIAAQDTGTPIPDGDLSDVAEALKRHERSDRS